MKKKFYTLGTVLMAAAMSVSAQSVIDSDVTFDCPFDEGDYAGESMITISNATVTMENEYLNTCGLPFLNVGDVVVLSDGGKVKFFDSPETAYPDPEAAAELGWGDYMLSSDGTAVTEMPFNWVIEGEGNEIYLDSHSTMGGTITGTGTLTIYVGNQNKINFDSWYESTSTTAAPQFTGTLILKTLDGYTCDTLWCGSNFPGHSTDGVAYNKPSGQWAGVPFWMDVTGLNNPVLVHGSNYSSWPAIKGECTLYSPRTHMFRNPVECYYDAVVNGGNEGYDFEMYPGALMALNKPVNAASRYAYLRQGQLLLFNSKEASFSNNVSGISARHRDSRYGGDGWVDAGISGKDGNTVLVQPGHSGPNSIGTLVAKSVWLYNNNGLDLDFDGQSADKLAVTDSANFTGAYTRVWLNLMNDFFTNTKTGNYSVLDGKCVIGMEAINDTVGYYVVDSAMTYAVWNEAAQDFADTVTYYPNIKKYGAYKDNNGGNRELDTMMYWGPGTGGYGTPEAYVPNPNKVDYATWQVDYSARLRDSLNAIVYVPGTGDTVKYVSHNFTANDIALHYAYDYRYNFNLVVKNNSMVLPNPYIPGDSVRIGSDFFNFSFQSTDETTGETTYRYNTPAVTVWRNAEKTDSINYWFDFTYFFTDGVIQLLSDEKTSVDLGDAPVNGDFDLDEWKDENDVPDGITNRYEDNHSVADRQIYTIDGKRVNTLVPGLNVVTTRYKDGEVKTMKIFFQE